MTNNTQYLRTFLFRKTWGELFLLLPDEDAGALIKAVFVHARGESASAFLQDRPELRPAARSIIKELEAGARRFLDKKEISDWKDAQEPDRTGVRAKKSFEDPSAPIGPTCSSVPLR